MSKKISLNFGDNTPKNPVQPVVIPPAPHSQLSDVLPETEVKSEREAIVCKDMLDEETLRQAKLQAEILYPRMRGNLTELIDYGKAQVAELNALIERMLKEVEVVEIPELLEKVREVSYAMNDLQQKHDVTDPKVKEEIEKEINGKKRKGIFGKTVSLIDQIRIDASTMEQQIDAVESEWLERQQMLIKNVALDDELYIKNEAEIMGVIGVIAVMELILDLAQNDIKAIVIDPNDPADRAKSEQKRELSGFVDTLNLKISEYKNRMVVGWTTSPQISNRRNANVALILKLDSQRDLILPLMRKTILEWTGLIQSKQAGELTDILAKSASGWFEASARAGAEALPQIVRAAHTPSLSDETIRNVAGYVDQQTQGILDVFREVTDKQSAASDAIVKAQRLIQQGSEDLSEFAVDDRMQKAAKRLGKLAE